MTVVDASVVVSAAIQADAMHAASRSWLEETLGTGTRLFVPTLFLVEVAGAITRRTRDQALARQTIDRFVDDPLVEVVAVDGLTDIAISAAMEHSLRGADAVYVALAQDLGVPLVTWDRELLKSASRLLYVLRPVIISSE